MVLCTNLANPHPKQVKCVHFLKQQKALSKAGQHIFSYEVCEFDSRHPVFRKFRILLAGHFPLFLISIFPTPFSQFPCCLDCLPRLRKKREGKRKNENEFVISIFIRLHISLFPSLLKKWREGGDLFLIFSSFPLFSRSVKSCRPSAVFAHKKKEFIFLPRWEKGVKVVGWVFKRPGFSFRDFNLHNFSVPLRIKNETAFF